MTQLERALMPGLLIPGWKQRATLPLPGYRGSGHSTEHCREQTPTPKLPSRRSVEAARLLCCPAVALILVSCICAAGFQVPASLLAVELCSPCIWSSCFACKHHWDRSTFLDSTKLSQPNFLLQTFGKELASPFHS